MSNVLVVSVHPDDETLGCGGTILKHKNKKDCIDWLIITDASEKLGYDKEFIEKRADQIKKVSFEYGFNKVYNLGLPTTKLQNIDISEIITRISEIITKVQPQIVYFINRSDVHTDHQIAAKALISCTKSFRYPYIKKVLMYECISETEISPSLPENIFIPNVFSDISDYMDKKIEIMKIYDTEVQDPPLPRSLDNIRALARFRGATVGVNYAEAFMLIRDVF